MGGIVLDPLSQRHQSVDVGSRSCGDGGQSRILLLSYDFSTPRRVPGAYQLSVRQVLRKPDAALAERYGMREDPADPRQGGTRECHDRVMDRMEYLMSQVERAIAECLLKKV